MDPQVITALTQLIVKEINAASIYQNLMTYFQNNALPGYSSRMQLRVGRKQSRITLIQNYLYSRGQGTGKIPGPAIIPVFATPIEALTFINIQQADETALMNQIITMAIDFGDNQTVDFVRSLVDEQTEEEATASELLKRTQMRYNGPLPQITKLKPIDYNLP